MEISHQQIERTYTRLVLGSLVGFLAFIFLCWGGCHLYDHVQSRHLARRAAGYLSGGNLRDAMLSARRALQLEESAEATRVMAEIAERANDRMALEWRRKTLQLAPNSNADLLALASCALQFNEIAEADKALASIEESRNQTAPFFAVKARIAEARNDSTTAQQFWSRATELDPQNKSYALRLGLARLKISDAGIQEQGRVLLQDLRADEGQRAAATRGLISDAIGRREEAQKIRTLAFDLQNYPEATFPDRILYLEILRQMSAPEYTGYLTGMEKDAATKATDLAALLAWMNTNQMSLIALDYAKPLPEKILKTWPVPRLIAEAYSRITDWAAVEKITKDENWGQFDFLRRAYLARAFRGQNKSVAAEREWAGATKSAGAQSEMLGLLARTVSEWGWKSETFDLLWQLSKFPEAQNDALQTLYRQYAKEADTQGLYRVLVRLAEIDPSDLKVQNNLAQISLLLHADVVRARQLAADIFRKEPSNVAYASTYAFSLFEKSDFKGALRVMNVFGQDKLKDPPVAAYYGIILAADGEREKAREYVDLGKKAHLLPEEKALIERAEASLR